MQHLTLPHDSLFSNVDRIPLLGNQRYDGGPWLTYPLRVIPPRPQFLENADFSSLMSQEYSRPTRTYELEEFCQSWLFFGTLQELLGLSGVYERFVQHGFINTRGLVDAIGGWLESERKSTLSDDIKRAKYRHNARCLRHATKVLRIIDLRKDPSAHPTLSGILKKVTTSVGDLVTAAQPVVSSDFRQKMLSQVQPLFPGKLKQMANSVGVKLSLAQPPFSGNLKRLIASIGELLSTATEAAADDTNFPSDGSCPNSWDEHFYDNSIEGQMIQNGWCPSEIYRMKEKLTSLSTLLFMSKMVRRTTHYNHSFCSAGKCEGLQIDPNIATVRHRLPCHNCVMVDVDRKLIQHAQTYGTFPVVRVQPGEGESFTLETALASEVPYVAISHIWADGLGIPMTNSMPSCQLKFLHEAMIRISKSSSKTHPTQDSSLSDYFWIDTLCFPNQPQDLDAKRKALSQMRNVYKEAASVLVIDASLYRYNLSAMTTVEISARILNSPWMYRVWTFQEAVLAAELWFVFRDRPISLSQIHKRMKTAGNTSIGQDITIIMMGERLKTIATINSSKATARKATLGTVRDALYDRQLSKTADEALCIAAALDLDVNFIVSSAPDDRVSNAAHGRMKALWSIMPRAFNGVPRNIIFYPSPRLTTQGYRWAPASLLVPNDAKESFPPRLSTENDTPGTPTAHGLQVNYPGFRLRPSKPFLESQRALWKKGAMGPRVDQISLVDPNGIWYEITANTNTSTTARGLLDIWDDLDDGVSDLILLFEVAFDSEGMRKRFPSAKSVPVLHGILGRVVGVHDGCEIIQTEISVSVLRWDVSHTLLLNTARTCAERLCEDNVMRKMKMYSVEGEKPNKIAFQKTLVEFMVRFKEMEKEILRNPDVARAASHRENIMLYNTVKLWHLGAHGFIAQEWNSDKMWFVD